ncbi:hypothetical protein NG895_02975 [Aeoliella sp. ICT_H6.2]|uniref:Uncharacterized protein n=1 Tax=Aeoliella straminimaris TaxID=2954799 RepID=A0A9X2F770_9BACT|nr:hypothetical protein [Aeoliella straminimaris]MCO6042862.1 hypothetical protein [Aeoliella straminimaris]
MTERERWIVYPLLFLALGASLRDKIIKSTHNQLVTCEALCVLDKDEKPLLVLGSERYPELSPTNSDFLMLDSLRTDSLKSNSIAGETILGHQMRIGRLEADAIVAKNYVLTDGKHQLPILGRYTEPLLNIYKAITAQYQIQRRSTLQKAIEARRKQLQEQANQKASAESTTKPPAEPDTEASAGPDTEASAEPAPESPAESAASPEESPAAVTEPESAEPESAKPAVDAPAAGEPKSE